MTWLNGLANKFLGDTFSPALSALLSSYLTKIESTPFEKLWKPKGSIEAERAMQVHCRTVQTHTRMLLLASAPRKSSGIHQLIGSDSCLSRLPCFFWFVTSFLQDSRNDFISRSNSAGRSWLASTAPNFMASRNFWIWTKDSASHCPSI